MSEPTKACNLTEDEVKELISHHGRNINEYSNSRIERINYLNKRLKSFNDVEVVFEKELERPAPEIKDGW